MNQPINIFDFDGTLTTETWPKFWVWVKKFGYCGTTRNDDLENALKKYRENHSGSHLETFFGFFNDLLQDNNKKITLEELMEGEKYIKYNIGVKTFLKSSHAKNYIVSGGLKDFLDNLAISSSFEGIYGTPVLFDECGLIKKIGNVMTDDNKILAIQDILKRNNRIENDCKNVFYIGDGYSDAAAMRFVHENGGKSIFVYQPNQNDDLYQYNLAILKKLKDEEVIDYYCEADYQDNTMLYNLLERK